MSLQHINALITGASGGIGAAVATGILQRGGRAVLTARDPRSLKELAHTIDPSNDRTISISADVTISEDRRRICELAHTWQGGVNTLVNIAGVGDFGLFESERRDEIDRAFDVNVLAPVKLCHALLPHLSRQRQAHIVNLGSVFGAIGYPGHAVYSATKFALRGFSEALRRELIDTSVRVHYLAPRATRTKFNSSAVNALNELLGIAVDPPERVADALCALLETGTAESVIGWPEKFFVRLNALLPRIVDRSLAKQLPAIRQHARSKADTLPIQSFSRRAS